jgi:hypothetical protein
VPINGTHADHEAATLDWARARDVLVGEDAFKAAAAADAQFVKWLMDHQKEAGVFTTVSGLVEQLCDNPAARLAAQEISNRLRQAQEQARLAPPSC